MFSKKQIKEFLKEAGKQNNLSQGDTACFYLTKK